MLRVIAACLFVSLIFAALPANAQVIEEPMDGAAPQSIALIVKTSFLCVTVRVTASGDMHTWVTIDWGDGVVEEWVELACTPGCSGRLSHTYATEGTYIIRGTHLADGSVHAAGAIVTDSPEFTLSSYDQGENWIQLATIDSVYTARASISTIDWGDGGAIEEFKWGNCEGGGFCTPIHVYPAAGEYPVVARIEYLDFRSSTCYERTATFQAMIGLPSPVRNSTWGAIKALFDD